MEWEPAASHHEAVSLFWRVFAINAIVLVAAVAVLDMREAYHPEPAPQTDLA